MHEEMQSKTTLKVYLLHISQNDNHQEGNNKYWEDAGKKEHIRCW
jgi:hypothetical protein